MTPNAAGDDAEGAGRAAAAAAAARAKTPRLPEIKITIIPSGEGKNVSCDIVCFPLILCISSL